MQVKQTARAADKPLEFAKSRKATTSPAGSHCFHNYRIANRIALDMLRIEKRSESSDAVSYAISGRLREDLSDLEATVKGEQRRVTLDLREVTIVSREAVVFLGHCERNGVVLVNCPGYVREWIDQEGPTTG
jgi:hypothetical protein